MDRLGWSNLYSNARLERFIEETASSPWISSQVLGYTEENRPLHKIRVHDPGVPVQATTVVWMTGIQHPAELVAGWGLEKMIAFLLGDDPVAGIARRNYDFHFVPVVNVDMVAEGAGRIHRSLKNPNREWEQERPIREVRLIRDAMDQWCQGGRSIGLFLDMHGFASPHGWWVEFGLPEEDYPSGRREEYARFRKILHAKIPMQSYLHDQYKGYSLCCGFRRFGAISFSFDGMVYPEKSTVHAFYESGGPPVDSFEGIIESARLFIEVLADVAENH